MIVEVISGGLQTTVQDSGRYGYQWLGVSTAGVMDEQAYELANILVGNSKGTPCLEMCYSGVTLKVTGSVEVAITGANYSVMINNRPAPMYETLHLIKGDILAIAYASQGIYGYLSFSKPMKIESVLNSYSTDLKGQIGGFKGRKLEDGDLIEFLEDGDEARLIDRSVAENLRPDYLAEPSIRFVEGIEYRRYSRDQQEEFQTSFFTVSKNMDRMGYRVSGPKIAPIDGCDILSDGISKGTIQGTPSGEFLVLLSDRQPTGGYVRIGHVISVDLPRFVQLTPGERFRFKRVSLEDAHEALREYDCLKSRWQRELEKPKYLKIKRKRHFKIKTQMGQYSVEVAEIRQED